MKYELDKYLSMEPYEFDQGENGWRELDEDGKFLEAAQIIATYLELNKDKVKNYTRESPELGNVMVFHAGQLYATAGPEYYSEALSFLRDSFRPQDEGWNLYVKGTIAFLDGNKQTLDECLNALTKIDPKHVRVTVLNKLKKGLEQAITYQQAYDSK